MNIVENYFNRSIIDQLKELVNSPQLPWYYQENVVYYQGSGNSEEKHVDNFYHSHIVYEDFKPYSNTFSIFIPVLKALEVNSLIRIKINKYPRTNKVIKHTAHKDYEFSHKGCILFLNSCDGYTEIENKKVTSVENRVVLFDPSISHNSTTCTNSRFRLTITFNYF